MKLVLVLGVFVFLMVSQGWSNEQVNRLLIETDVLLEDGLRGVYFYDRPTIPIDGYYTIGRTITLYDPLLTHEQNLFVMKHEIGHHRCWLSAYDISEACANQAMKTI